MSIFPREWLDIELPKGWHAARFPTIMSGEVIRFYRGEDRDEAPQLVNASRDGVGLSMARHFYTATALYELRDILDIAEAHADRLAWGDRGRWVPVELFERLQRHKQRFNISALVAAALDAKLTDFEEHDSAILAAAELFEAEGGDEKAALATRLRAYVKREQAGYR